MNVKQLEKKRGASLRLRPLPHRRGENGVLLDPKDDQWRLEEVLDAPARVRLTNIHTGHTLTLHSDNIKEFRTPDFLLLRCQLLVTPTTVALEPLFDASDIFVRLEYQMPALLSEMRQDLAATPLKREIVLLGKNWSHWAKGTELVYYFDDHPDLASQFQIMSNQGLVTETTYNNVTRYQLSEQLARYLGA